MATTMPLSIIILMVATLLVLVVGLVLMAVGSEANEKYSNKLMVARVLLQGLAILMLAIMFFVMK